MKLKDIKALKRGDKVFWNDPDNGECSRVYTIHTIQVVNPEMVRITEDAPSVLECHPKELAPVQKFSVKLYWEMCAEVEIEAPNKTEAARLVLEGDLPSSDGWQYVPDSENVDEELDVQRLNG